MSDILGHDCDGRPLRAGDRVVILRACNPSARHLEGEECAIRGPSRSKKRDVNVVELDIPFPHGPPGRYWKADTPSLRRIDDKPEASTWDDVRRATGWQPGRIHEEA